MSARVEKLSRPASGTRIEDYAVLGNGRTAALISRAGSVDWLCWPRFDSPACFAALLGTPDHGCWRIAPAEDFTSKRRYRDGTLILETIHETDTGAVRVTDYMPAGGGQHLARSVDGLRGSVRMTMEFAPSFDYGSARPFIVRTENDDIRAVSGPSKLLLRTRLPIELADHAVQADFTLGAGQSAAFVLSYAPSHKADPPAIEPRAELAATERLSFDWTGGFAGGTPWDDVLLRSLLTLKALIYAPTGGIVAAPTTSLPESIGGPRNWDYRYCWLRDSAFTLTALLDAGYLEEARAWHDWLIRTAAGVPEETRTLYGIAGERLIPEIEIDWLPGYEGSHPVRIGNAASGQFQLDVYGEVFDAMYQGMRRGLSRDPNGWRGAKALLKFLEQAWQRPDEGIWEVRGGKRHFVHSKVMAWVAFDRAIQMNEERSGDPLLARWAMIRETIHAEVCAEGFDKGLNSFVQYYGAQVLDASVLLMMHVGFLPADDPRMKGTVDAIGRTLMRDGFVLRYDAQAGNVDGLTSGPEGAFLPCSFWYADNLVAQGRHEEAKIIIERSIGTLNDVGLMAEEYDPRAGRMLGNFPQAFSHVALANTILRYSRANRLPIGSR